MTAQTLMTMGTRLEFLLPSCDAPALWAEIREEVLRLNKVFNRFEAESDVSRYGRGESPSPTLEDAMRLCECYRTLSCGLFDIRKGAQGRELDFGGFAKGLAMRKIASMLRSAGVADAYVSFGGSSILALGKHPSGEDWKVAVEDPYTGMKIDECVLSDMSLSVSGNTPTYTGHIIDPRTGQGNFEHKMTIVLCPDPLDAEILSTSAMIADEKQVEIVEKNFPSAEIKLYLL